MLVISPESFMGEIRSGLTHAKEHHRRTGRPFCTLAYAQSVDGCISGNPRRHLLLSSRKSLVLTHHLRSWHDAILVGVRTVLADDPSLSVRLVRGRDPQPVVLDSGLRTPPDSNLLNHGTRRPWIAAGQGAATDRQQLLETRGARVLHLPTTRRGWVALGPLLDQLGQRGITSLMVEGGARVLTCFMETRLVDQVIITIAPVIVGGVRAFRRTSRNPTLLTRFHNVRYAGFDQDLMVWGRPRWEKE